MKGLSLEVRVGLLILVAVGLLTAFVMLLGGQDLIADAYTVYVDFNNPGNLQPGASVNVGSVRVGRIEGITYRGGVLEPQTGKRSLIRVTVRLDKAIQNTIHDDARFYVTSTGLVGETLLAIEPGTPERRPLREGAIVVGVDSPRLDLALSLAYELLQNISSLLRDNREEIESLLHAAANMIRQLDGLFTRHSDRIDHIVTNVEEITTNTNDLIQHADGLISGPEVRRIVRNVDHTMSSVSRNIDPVLADARSITHKVDELLDMIGPQQQQEIRTAIHDGQELISRANAMSVDAQSIVTHIREGRGTVGALLMDEEIYDDVTEMLRDLKHNPWKLFWRE